MIKGFQDTTKRHNILLMSTKIIVPNVVYNVISMTGKTFQMSSSSFYKKLESDGFVHDIQSFNRSMPYKKTSSDEYQVINQQPCLIIKELVTQEHFSDYHRKLGESFYKLYNTITDSNVYYPDRFMITYGNFAEPILPVWTLFDRNMNLLLSPDMREGMSAHNMLANADILGRNMYAAIGTSAQNIMN